MTSNVDPNVLLSCEGLSGTIRVFSRFAGFFSPGYEVLLFRQKDPTTVALCETHHAKFGLVVALRVPCAVRRPRRRRKLAALKQCDTVYPKLAARLGHAKGQKTWSRLG